MNLELITGLNAHRISDAKTSLYSNIKLAIQMSLQFIGMGQDRKGCGRSAMLETSRGYVPNLFLNLFTIEGGGAIHPPKLGIADIQEMNSECVNSTDIIEA